MRKLLVFIMAILSLFLVSCDITFGDDSDKDKSNEEIIYNDYIKPDLTIDSIDKVNYSIENVCDKIIDTNVQVLDSKGSIKIICKELSGIIKNLDSTEKYQISGYYKGYINDKLYKVNIESVDIHTGEFEDILDIKKELCVSNVFSNLFVVDTKPYVEATPEGYSFAGITITEKNGDSRDIAYTGQSSICVEDLKSNTEYCVGSYYYEITSQSRSLMSFKTSNSNNYVFRFVGFWIVSGSLEANKVEMVYNNEVLYTYYVEDGGMIFDPYRFMLPTKYNGYYVVGSDQNLNNPINSDLVCNLILALENPTNEVYVVFYDFDENIYHIETVQYGESAVGPATPPPSVTKGGVLYEFDRWNRDYSNVTSNISVYPIKKDNSIIPPTIEIPVVEYANTLISKEYLSSGFGVKSGVNAIINTNVYLKDLDGNIINIDIEVKTGDTYFIEYDSTKTYELHTEIEYKLDGMTDSAYITNIQEINYSAINAYDKGNYEFESEAAHDTNRNVHIKVRYDDIDMLVRYMKVNDYSSFFLEYEVESNVAYVENLNPGYTYCFNYAFKDNADDKLYYVSERTFEVATMSKADFGLEEIYIHYYYDPETDVQQPRFFITFVGEKAEQYIKMLDSFFLHGVILENMQRLECQLDDVNFIETGIDEAGRKYATINGHSNSFVMNPDNTTIFYDYHINQITLNIDNEFFNYYSTDEFKETEFGIIQYYDFNYKFLG